MPHYHFIAIGGAGMSGIARILVESGNRVSGSDIKESDTTRRLSELGADVRLGHRADNIPDDAEVVVVSSAIHSDNPEVVEAKRRGIKLVHRGEMLALLMERGRGIAVAGAHGKTTTTSMVAVMLEKAGADPTVLVGGEVSDFGGNAKLGNSDLIVAEADESDGSFLKLSPYIAIVTNIDDDHLDYYGDLEHVKAAFREFMHHRVRQDGYLVYCGDDCNARVFGASSPRKAVSYGLGEACDVSAFDMQKTEWGTRYSVEAFGRHMGEVTLQVPGHHNVLNSLAAIAVGMLLDLDFSGVALGLGSFKGAQRRLTLIGKEGGVLVLDDYAHHPTEVKASLKAIRGQVQGRVLCIYQPHRYSRTLALKDEFGTAFVDCDQLYLADIYAGPGESPIIGVTSELIASSVRSATKQEPFHISSWAALIESVVNEALPGDAIVTMGAGDVYKMGPDVLLGLRNKSSSERM